MRRSDVVSIFPKCYVDDDGCKSERLRGLVRVTTSGLKQLVQNSGRPAGGVCTFFAPIEWNSVSSVEPFDVKPAPRYVSWDDDESAMHYAMRCWEAATRYGVVLGQGELGCRRPRIPGEDVSSMWLIEGVPQQWGAGDIVAIVSEAGYRAAAIVGHPFIKRRAAVWRFKAKIADGSDDVATLAAKDDKEEITYMTITKCKPRAKAEITSTLYAKQWLHNDDARGKKGNYGPTATEAKVKTEEEKSPQGDNEPAKKKPKAGKDEKEAGDDAEQAVADAQATPVPMGAGEIEEYKRKTTAAKAAETEEIRAKRARKAAFASLTGGMKRQAVTGDRNCTWRSLAGALAAKEIKIQWAKLKATVVGHMRSDEKDYKAMWHGDEPSAEGKDMAKEGFQEYCRRLGMAKAWAGELEVWATSVKYDTPVLVASVPDEAVHIYNRAGKRDPIAIIWDGNHYDFLGGKVPEEAWQDAAKVEPPKRRGGAKGTTGPRSRATATARSRATSSIASGTTGSWRTRATALEEMVGQKQTKATTPLKRGGCEKGPATSKSSRNVIVGSKAASSKASGTAGSWRTRTSALKEWAKPKSTTDRIDDDNCRVIALDDGDDARCDDLDDLDDVADLTDNNGRKF